MMTIAPTPPNWIDDLIAAAIGLVALSIVAMSMGVL